MKRLSMLAILLGTILVAGCNEPTSTAPPTTTDAPAPTAPPAAKPKGRVKAMAPAANKPSMTPVD
ncbi:hypothetical protein [Singulisphaera sp. PoT]|uniref:hypothetical protein n=1 Tax=Singulisphaera sp. PoT TaxID=3411797 RepID=UPI003BF55640